MINKFLFLLGCMTLLVACSQSTDTPSVNVDEDVVEDEIQEEDTLVVTDTISDILNGRVEYNLVSPDGADTSLLEVDYAYYIELDSAYKDSVNHYIAELFCRSDEQRREWSHGKLDSTLFEAYLTSFSKDYREYAEAFEGEVVWSLEYHVGIDDDYKGHVEINHGAWSYEGGAHGNGYSQTTLIDRETGRKLGLKDFFSDLDELARISEPYFREQNNVEEGVTLEEHGYEFGDEFYVSDNFSISSGGLYVYYDRYEIGPYAMPPSDMTVPMSKIKHLLTREF